MLIVALVLAVIGLAALVTAVVTSNELIAWVCIAASVIGVLLLIIDAVRERSKGRSAARESEAPPVEHNPEVQYYEDYPDDETTAIETGTVETGTVETGTESPDVDTTSTDDAETTVVEKAESDEDTGR